ncbi:hypothetical protein BI291_08650 [Thalassotalea sp. PP2-459]|nr:hypothetical protein BI291_08650 [Thalassotalea sp. PP2-459]
MNNIENDTNDKQIVEALRENALSLRNVVPPEAVWNRINDTLETRKTKYNYRTWLPTFAVASAFVCAVSFFSWQHHVMKKELDLMITLNASLEDVFLQENKVRFINASNIVELQAIDRQLNTVTSIKEKISLLKERKRLIESMTITEIKESTYAI